MQSQNQEVKVRVSWEIKLEAPFQYQSLTIQKRQGLTKKLISEFIMTLTAEVT